jgi:hypothetical protein
MGVRFGGPLLEEAGFASVVLRLSRKAQRNMRAERQQSEDMKTAGCNRLFIFLRDWMNKRGKRFFEIMIG